jgi:dephospho-CoA kinase
MKERAKEIKGGHVILGVTGGIASGKTTVARMLEELGARVIDFDRLARQIVEPGKPALKEIAAFFGDGVLGSDGRLDRRGLGSLVFQDEKKRKELERITHPRIVAVFHEQVRAMAEKGPALIIQAVIPLLFEANLGHLVHKVLLVYIPREMQVERFMSRDGVSREAAENVLQAQWPIDEKIPLSDFVIRNDRSPEETRKQVEALWEEVTKRHKAQGRKSENVRGKEA